MDTFSDIGRQLDYGPSAETADAFRGNTQDARGTEGPMPAETAALHDHAADDGGLPDDAVAAAGAVIAEHIAWALTPPAPSDRAPYLRALVREGQAIAASRMNPKLKASDGSGKCSSALNDSNAEISALMQQPGNTRSVIVPLLYQRMGTSPSKGKCNGVSKADVTAISASSLEAAARLVADVLYNHVLKGAHDLVEDKSVVFLEMHWLPAGEKAGPQGAGYTASRSVLSSHSMVSNEVLVRQYELAFDNSQTNTKSRRMLSPQRTMLSEATSGGTASMNGSYNSFIPFAPKQEVLLNHIKRAVIPPPKFASPALPNRPQASGDRYRAASKGVPVGQEDVVDIFAPISAGTPSANNSVGDFRYDLLAASLTGGSPGAAPHVVLSSAGPIDKAEFYRRLAFHLRRFSQWGGAGGSELVLNATVLRSYYSCNSSATMGSAGRDGTADNDIGLLKTCSTSHIYFVLAPEDGSFINYLQQFNPMSSTGQAFLQQIRNSAQKKSSNNSDNNSPNVAQSNSRMIQIHYYPGPGGAASNTRPVSPFSYCSGNTAQSAKPSVHPYVALLEELLVFRLASIVFVPLALLCPAPNNLEGSQALCNALQQVVMRHQGILIQDRDGPEVQAGASNQGGKNDQVTPDQDSQQADADVSEAKAPQSDPNDPEQDGSEGSHPTEGRSFSKSPPETFKPFTLCSDILAPLNITLYPIHYQLNRSTQKRLLALAGAREQRIATRAMKSFLQIVDDRAKRGRDGDGRPGDPAYEDDADDLSAANFHYAEGRDAVSAADFIIDQVVASHESQRALLLLSGHVRDALHRHSREQERSSSERKDSINSHEQNDASEKRGIYDEDANHTAASVSIKDRKDQGDSHSAMDDAANASHAATMTDSIDAKSSNKPSTTEDGASNKNSYQKEGTATSNNSDKLIMVNDKSKRSSLDEHGSLNYYDKQIGGLMKGHLTHNEAGDEKAPIGQKAEGPKSNKSNDSDSKNDASMRHSHEQDWLVTAEPTHDGLEPFSVGNSNHHTADADEKGLFNDYDKTGRDALDRSANNKINLNNSNNDSNNNKNSNNDNKPGGSVDYHPDDADRGNAEKRHIDDGAQPHGDPVDGYSDYNSAMDNVFESYLKQITEDRNKKKSSKGKSEDALGGDSADEKDNTPLPDISSLDKDVKSVGESRHGFEGDGSTSERSNKSTASPNNMPGDETLAPNEPGYMQSIKAGTSMRQDSCTSIAESGHGDPASRSSPRTAARTLPTDSAGSSATTGMPQTGQPDAEGFEEMCRALQDAARTISKLRAEGEAGRLQLAERESKLLEQGDNLGALMELHQRTVEEAAAERERLESALADARGALERQRQQYEATLSTMQVEAQARAAEGQVLVRDGAAAAAAAKELAERLDSAVARTKERDCQTIVSCMTGGTRQGGTDGTGTQNNSGLASPAAAALITLTGEVAKLTASAEDPQLSQRWKELLESEVRRNDARHTKRREALEKEVGDLAAQVAALRSDKLNLIQALRGVEMARRSASNATQSDEGGEVIDAATPSRSTTASSTAPGNSPSKTMSRLQLAQQETERLRERLRQVSDELSAKSGHLQTAGAERMELQQAYDDLYAQNITLKHALALAQKGLGEERALLDGTPFRVREANMSKLQRQFLIDTITADRDLPGLSSDSSLGSPLSKTSLPKAGRSQNSSVLSKLHNRIQAEKEARARTSAPTPSHLFQLSALMSSRMASQFNNPFLNNVCSTPTQSTAGKVLGTQAAGRGNTTRGSNLTSGRIAAQVTPRSNGARSNVHTAQKIADVAEKGLAGGAINISHASNTPPADYEYVEAEPKPLHSETDDMNAFINATLSSTGKDEVPLPDNKNGIDTSSGGCEPPLATLSGAEYGGAGYPGGTPGPGGPGGLGTYLEIDRWRASEVGDAIGDFYSDVGAEDPNIGFIQGRPNRAAALVEASQQRSDNKLNTKQ